MTFRLGWALWHGQLSVHWKAFTAFGKPRETPQLESTLLGFFCIYLVESAAIQPA